MAETAPSPKRRLVTLRLVTAITRPRPRNPRRDVVHIDGWTVIARRAAFSPGQPVVFFEIDAFLPATDGRF